MPTKKSSKKIIRPTIINDDAPNDDNEFTARIADNDWVWLTVGRFSLRIEKFKKSVKVSAYRLNREMDPAIAEMDVK